MRNAIKKKEEAYNQLSSRLLEERPAVQRRTLHCIVKGGASGWLTVLPLREEGYSMTCQLPSFETSWRFAITMNHLDSQQHVMDVVHLLAYSMVSTVPRVGWSRKATMISMTVMPGLLMWVGEGWPLRPFLYQRMTRKVNQCYRLTGWSEGFGRETGWRFSMTASLMPTHLHVVMPEPTFHEIAFLHGLHPPRTPSTV